MSALTDQEIDNFASSPRFVIDTKLHWENIDKEWTELINSNAPLLTHFLQYGMRRGDLYTTAMYRYTAFHTAFKSVQVKDPLYEPLCLVLAESYFWLGDYHGSHRKLDTLASSLAERGINDTSLQGILDVVRVIKDRQLADDISEEEHPDVDSALFGFLQIESPGECPSMDPDANMLDIMLRSWNDCQTLVGNKLASDIFARYASLTSNELENVFEIDPGSTWHRLVRKGFYDTVIGGVTKSSKIQSRSRIIKVLENTNKTFDVVGSVLSDFTLYTSGFIKEIHETVIEGENFEVEYNEETNNYVMLIQVIPAGNWIILID